MPGWMPMIVMVLGLSMTRPAFAQEWIEYTSLEDRFSANFPGEPEVRETTWRSEYGADLPARVYRATRGEGRYTLTVVDYNFAEPILTAKAEECPPGAEPCDGRTSIAGIGYWRNDVRGALVYASWQFMQRDVEVTHYMWTFFNQTETHLLQLTNNADRSRTFVSIAMYDNRLYITEATVPSGYPPPGLFQQSIVFLAEDGGPFDHLGLYYNGDRLEDVCIRVGRCEGEVVDPAPGLENSLIYGTR